MAERIGDSIILIDNDIASVASLTSMLEKFSYKVISVDAASEALSMIEKQKKDIGLLIANIEMPDIDSPSFLTALFHKNILLILINPEMKTKETSDLLTKAACFFLNKPISENDIKNMWQHVLPEKIPGLNKTNIAESEESKIEAFRVSLKRQGISHACLLRVQPFIETFTTFETSKKRRIEKESEEENNVGRCNNLSTDPFKKPTAERKEEMPKFLLGGTLDLTNNPFFGNVINQSSIDVSYVPSDTSKKPAYNISFTDNANITGLVSTGLSSDNLSVRSGLPSRVGASNVNVSQESAEICIPQFDSNPFHPPSSVLETDTNHWLENYGSSEQNNSLLPSYLGYDFTPNNLMEWNPHIATEGHNHNVLVSTGLSSDNFLISSGLPSGIGASSKDACQILSTDNLLVPYGLPSRMGVSNTDACQILSSNNLLVPSHLPSGIGASSTDACQILSIDNLLVPSGLPSRMSASNTGACQILSSDNFLVPSGLPSEIGASKTDASQIISSDITVAVNQQENIERENKLEYDRYIDWIVEMMDKDV